jgi:cyclopropane fatty-acyl-phospholipid synthase-like methyltransferase
MTEFLDSILSRPRSILWKRLWEVRGCNEDVLVARGGIGNTRQELDDSVQHIADSLRLSPDDSLLDIGCNVGYITEKLGGKVKRVTGVDISSAAIAQAREALRNHPAADVFVSEAARIARPAGSFSKIVCFSIVHYFPSKAYWKEFLLEVKRLLAPGGVALIGDLPRRGKFNFDMLSRYRFFKKLYMIPITIGVDLLLQNRYTESEVIKTAAEVGFAATIIRQPDSLPFHATRFDVLLTDRKPAS